MTRVLIVDDSAVVRRTLTDLLTAGGLKVIGAAPDPLFAFERMKAEWPDVIVLDVEMPRMDGITFLQRVMAERPTPVVMCSTLTEKGAETTMQALAAGAVGFVTKPKLGLKGFLEDRSNGIVHAVRAAAQANMRALPRAAQAPGVRAGGGAVAPAAMPVPGSPAAREAVRSASQAMATTTDHVIAMGLSTGGVQTVEAVLPRLPRTAPGMVMVQHMPAKFTAGLASRLNALCEVEVAEARDGDRVINGRVLIAPGGRHMRLKRSGAQYVVEVFDAPLFNHHRPSVDVLFKSVAQCAGRNASGILMTGMGDDGARGLLEMRRAGARTAAQNEATSVVFGMPAEAIRIGAAESVLALNDVPSWLVRGDGARATGG
ncbi:MAG: chemotaxis response regulator protein-glutamate methylesterase [Burkholderiaceae bacterium]|nr:chemotaxis response regulator protein-glutamate methylesterase [Burkholderiaceae bacterium]